jgi:hypothetical protein
MDNSFLKNNRSNEYLPKHGSLGYSDLK